MSNYLTTIHTITPLKSHPAWKLNPDLVLQGEKTRYRENIYPSLKMEARKNSRWKTVKTLYFVNFSEKTQKIGKVGDISLKQTLKRRDELKKELTPAGAKTPKQKEPQNPLYSVFPEYMKSIGVNFAPATKKKKYLAWDKLASLHEKPVAEITRADVIAVCDPWHKAHKHPTLEQIYNLASLLLDFADTMEYCQNQLAGKVITDFYTLDPTTGHGYLDPSREDHLQLLVNYIYSPENKTMSIRNALIFALLSGLRPGNVINLRTSNLKKIGDDFHLEFKPDNHKTGGKSGWKHVGLPPKLGRWLENLPIQNDLFFPSTLGTMLSDNTLSKALRGFSSLGLHITDTGEPGKFVAHSLRKVLSSFCNHKLGKKYTEAIKLYLLHETKGAIDTIYNKATYVQDSREVLEFWLNYVNSLLGKDILA